MSQTNANKISENLHVGARLESGDQRLTEDVHPDSQSENLVASDERLPEMEDLAEQIGEFIHYWGFKRVHGRIWTHLYLAQKPLDAADLVRQMRISKALVSISLRELMEYEVIEEVGKSPRGTQLYRTNPDILKVILSVLRQREKRIVARIQAAQGSLERAPSADRAAHGLSDESLKMLGELISKASLGLESFIAFKSVDFGEWRKDFITTDLAAEAELRARSIAPDSANKRGSKADQSAQDAKASTTSSGAAGHNQAAMTVENQKQNSGEAPVLASGKGIGFRMY